MVLEYILIGVLILAAIFLVVAVLLQKSKEGGLSGSIAGGQDTFYGKDKAGNTERKLKKLTIIVGAIFVLAVLVIYIMQPDYSNTVNMSYWQELSEYHDTLFSASHDH